MIKKVERKRVNRKRIVIGLVVTLGLLFVGLASLFGAAVAYGSYTGTDDLFLQKLITVPVLKYAVPAEKRGRVFLTLGLNNLGDSEKRAEFSEVPFEFGGRVEFGVKEVRSVGYMQAALDYSGHKSGGEIDLSNQVHIDIGGLEAKASSQEYLSEKNLYFKINSYPDIVLGTATNYLARGLVNTPKSDIRGTWYRVDLGSTLYEKVDEEGLIEDIIEILDEKNANYVGLSEIQGVSAFHFSYNLSMSDLKKLGIPNSKSDEIKIESMRIEIWFDDSGSVFKAAVFSELTDDSNNEIDVSVILEIWNIGDEVDIDEPEDYEEWEEFLSKFS